MRKPPLNVVRNEAEKSANIYLYGVIGDYWTDDPLTAKRFMRELTALEGQGFARVDVHINSPGGDVWEGFGICNAIRASKMDIHTWNDGLAASMGSAILASAKDGNRHAAKASLTMIHNASTIAWGNSEDMKQAAEFLDKHDNVLAGFYADATGKSVDEIKAEFFDFKDHWLTAEEGSALGLFAVESYDADTVPENVTNMPVLKIAALYGMPSDNEPSQKFMDKVITQVMDFFNPKNQTNQMNKFPKLVALAAVAANAITAEQMQAVNEEIQAEGVKGVTAVLESELTALKAEAEKAKGIQAKDDEISNLKAELQKEQEAKAALQAKLDAAAVPPVTPPAPEDKIAGDNSETETYETSVDAEAKQLWGI